MGIFGSFGWSGEAIDLLETKLKDGGFKFGFDPVRIKFSPNKPKIKELEEIGTHFGRKIIKMFPINFCANSIGFRPICRSNVSRENFFT